MIGEVTDIIKANSLKEIRKLMDHAERRLFPRLLDRLWKGDKPLNIYDELIEQFGEDRELNLDDLKLGVALGALASAIQVVSEKDIYFRKIARESWRGVSDKYTLEMVGGLAKVLWVIPDDPDRAMTCAELAELVDLSESQMRRDCRRLADLGLLRYRARRRSGAEGRAWEYWGIKFPTALDRGIMAALEKALRRAMTYL